MIAIECEAGHGRTGAKKYRYVPTGEDHLSLAFTYAWMAARDKFWRGPLLEYIGWDEW